MESRKTGRRHRPSPPILVLLGPCTSVEGRKESPTDQGLPARGCWMTPVATTGSRQRLDSSSMVWMSSMEDARSNGGGRWGAGGEEGGV